METKIFVRERLKVGKDEKKPRFRVLAVSGPDLHIRVKHIRKMELEQIAKKSGAEIVYSKIAKKKKAMA
jgi:hypothetical protein